MQIFMIPLFLGVIAILLKEWIALRRKRFGNITRREYESKAASYLRQKGFKGVLVGKGTQDGGRDVKGVYNGQTRYGQCKMYKLPKKVGVKDIRELFGVVKSKRGKGIFITTNGFTKSAKDFAKKTGIQCAIVPKRKSFNS